MFRVLFRVFASLIHTGRKYGVPESLRVSHDSSPPPPVSRPFPLPKMAAPFVLCHFPLMPSQVWGIIKFALSKIVEQMIRSPLKSFHWLRPYLSSHSVVGLGFY